MSAKDLSTDELIAELARRLPMTPDRCPEHQARLPCNGCRADLLAAEPDAATRTLQSQGVPKDAIDRIREFAPSTDHARLASGDVG